MAQRCSYLDPKLAADLDALYGSIQGKLVNMMSYPERWSIRKQDSARDEG